jgi:hypothetical protein
LQVEAKATCSFTSQTYESTLFDATQLAMCHLNCSRVPLAFSLIGLSPDNVGETSSRVSKQGHASCTLQRLHIRKWLVLTSVAISKTSNTNMKDMTEKPCIVQRMGKSKMQHMSILRNNLLYSLASIDDWTPFNSSQENKV